MNGYINEDASYFEGLDLKNATPIKHPLIEKIQATAKMVQAQKLKPRQTLEAKKAHDKLIAFFDDEVKQMIITHDTPQDRVRLNAVIRALYTTA